jgi:serine protease Do
MAGKPVYRSIRVILMFACYCLLAAAPAAMANRFPFFSMGFGFQKPSAREAESSLVRVNFVTKFHGAKDTVEINGRLLSDYSPIIIQSFSSTGIVLDNKGHIMTSLGLRWLDLQGGDSSIEVFKDGQKWKGKLVGVDQRSGRNGVAIIKVAGAGLSKTPICSKCEVKDGATIMAPISARTSRLQQVQVVSWTGQTAPDPGDWLIRADRPFEDTGIPVLTSDHRVLGFIAGQDPMGRSIVHPISQLLESADEILHRGENISTGWLGLFVQDINRTMGPGVFIQGLENDSPAKLAGINPGDRLVKYNGKDVADTWQFVQMVEGSPVGSKASIEIIRQGSPMTISALVGTRKPQPNQRLSLNLPGLPSAFGPMGMIPEPPRNQKLLIGVDTFLLDPPVGLFVNAVQEKSPAEAAGVLVGDVITAIDGQAIAGPMNFLNFLQTHNWGSQVLLRVNRKGTEITVPVNVTNQNFNHETHE